MSGVYRAIRDDDGAHRLQVRKVAGHQQPENFPARTQAWTDAIGNHRADREANKGVARHRTQAEPAQAMVRLACVAAATAAIGASAWQRSRG